MNKPYSDPRPTGFVGIDREVKGSKNLFEVVGALESIAHWMRESVSDYDLKDLKYLFAEALQDYKKYLDEK